MDPLRAIAFLVRTGDEHATVDRLFVSKHVKDLRLIVTAAWIAVLAAILLGPVVAVWAQIVDNWDSLEKGKTYWPYVRIGLRGLANFGIFMTPVLAVFGGVLAWAYQIGSGRLGVVDLFACEISTLCRITTVLDSVKRMTDKFGQGPQTCAPGGASPPASQFSSQENYFPVFDSSSNDLQALEARVVINITAFYTYMKAMRDGMRALMAIAPQPTPPPASTDPWYDAMRNVVYMIFFALESARKSVDDLVEFEPELIERTIVILISELEAYRFLREQFTKEADFRHQRIMLRETDYRDLAPKLCALVEQGRSAELASGSAAASDGTPEESKWLPSLLLLPELRSRYAAALAAAGTAA